MTSREIRNQFLEFFKNKNHKIVQGSPVVPYDDPTLLFTNAGMNQFKDVFLGTGNREYSRAADTQKCIRVSGKHNDLEEVGYDTYHHTFFEMLGNWSFGDYYKADAIAWAWELLTKVWGLPKERLWATVYKSDVEAFNLWQTKTDINPNHILRFAEKDNFWEMGETGPCGPCSEIHINLSDDLENGTLVNAGTQECIEIWNLVFIQYNRDAEGILHELPAKHVDTGMGFERLCAVLQNKPSNYDTDVFLPLINRIAEISGASYSDGDAKIPMRVIADHIRTLAFAIADGAMPGNEGRGYVLRRILRRAARYGRKLNLVEPFLFSLVEILSAAMGDVFPEIKLKTRYIEKIIKAEEESFNRTLDRGLALFDEVVEDMKRRNSTVVAGETAFKLYDTYGFPLDLTNVLARERNYTVDEARFTNLMDEQRTRAREATKEKLSSVNVKSLSLDSFEKEIDTPTEFIGYETLSAAARITGYTKDGGSDLVILNQTPFYAESGGQVSDLGYIRIAESTIPVADLTKIENRIIHILNNENDIPISPGLEVIAEVDTTRRWDIMRNHSATHFLHAALRNILGTHVQQSGSYVSPDHLRFDFTHFSKLSDEEISDIESLINDELRKNTPIAHYKNIPFESAKKMGALMFFGDKYGDAVNVVQFGDFSLEFCGGTHVRNSSEIGLFKIVSESSIAAGVRRIEAVTGKGIELFLNRQLSRMKNAEERYIETAEQKRKLEKELSELKLLGKFNALETIIAHPVKVSGVDILTGKVEADSMDELKKIGDELRLRIKSGIGLLAAIVEGKVGLVCTVSDNLIKEKNLSAGKLVGETAKILGGGGGGRPHLATAGAKDISKIDSVLSDFPKMIDNLL